MSQKEGWVSRFAKADSKIVTEITMVTSERSDRFTVRDIPTLVELMDAHAGSAPLASHAGLMIEKGELEQSTFDLHMKQMAYDLQAWKVYNGKLNDHYSAVTYTRSTWHLDAYNENAKAVTNLFDKVAGITSWSTTEPADTSFIKFKKMVEKTQQVTESNVAPRASEAPLPNGCGVGIPHKSELATWLHKRFHTKLVWRI